MTYLKRFFTTLFFIIIFTEFIPAQPFLYKDDHQQYSVSNLKRFIKINLSNGSKDTVYFRNNLTTDNLQSWIIEGENSNYTITNSYNKNIKMQINFDPVYSIYSIRNNSLYFTGKNKNSDFFAVINASSGKIEKQFPLMSYSKYGQMFLSKNESILYLSYIDSTVDTAGHEEVRLAYLSTLSNKIIKNKNLSELGIPGADKYYLVNGKKGIGIIESRFDNEDNYYNIFNFDNDSSSNTIYYHGNADPYFTNNGNYLILAEKIDSLVNGKSLSMYTGSIIIYNVYNQTLVKSLTLPANGLILNYDNFPDIIYYYENSTGKIMTLNIESIATSLSN
jgi:hypothetical protein